MRCVFCEMGETLSGQVTVTLDRGGTTVVVRHVPDDVCSVCGEYYLSQPVSEWISDRAEYAVEHGIELEILRYAA